VGVAQAGRKEAPAIPELGDDVRLVQRADPADEVTEVRGGAAAETREAQRGLGLGPAAARRDPARGREVVKGDDRQDAALAAGGAHAPVVVERGARELTVLGLDAAPLQGEAVSAEAEPGEQVEVVAVAVVVVAGVAARLLAGRSRRVLPRP